MKRERVVKDAGRYALAMVETQHPTTKESVNLLDITYREFQHLRPIQCVIINYGTQFYADKRDKEDNAKYHFEQHRWRIFMILCCYHSFPDKWKLGIIPLGRRSP